MNDHQENTPLREEEINRIISELNKIGNIQKFENARVGYEVAYSYFSYNANAVWSVFSTLLLTHTIITSAIALILGNFAKQENLLLLFTLGTIGIVFCVIWFFLARRHNVYVKYYIETAKELENNFLFPVSTLKKGEKIPKMTIIFGNTQWGFLQSLSSQILTNLIILGFFIMYCVEIYCIFL